jgi:hypothetical protein
VINASLDPEIVDEKYGTGDFHRVYHGEILQIRAAENAREKLGLAQSA